MTLYRSRLCCLWSLALLLWLVGGHSLCAQSTSSGREDRLPGSVRLTLPPVLYAVVGEEINVYFDNVALMLNPANFAFDVTCPKGRQHAERWTLTAAEADIGRHPFLLEVLNERNELVARDRAELVVVPANARTDEAIHVLLIGDSLTHASIYSQHLLDLCSRPGNPRLTLVGSHGSGGVPGVNRHEGYGGWTAQRFATHFTETARTGDYKLRGSPFLYVADNGEKRLDFARYCREVNEGRLPDIVTIFLGPNDVFSLKDETIDEGVERMLTHYDSLIRMVRDTSPTTLLAVMLPVPPAASQDAFGANYTTGQTRWQYRRNQHRLVEQMLERYARREKDGIHIIPTQTNLDCLRNYPAGSETANARTDQKVTRQNNGVHPATSGYHQIGDSLYAWLKAQTRTEAR